MKKQIKLLVLFLMLLLPIKVNAECSIQDKNEYIKSANLINYKLKYISDNEFKIIFNNIDEKLLIIDDIGLEYTNNQETGLTYKGGLTRYFSILANSNTNCTNEVIKELSIRIPLYNKYSENEICLEDKYKDFKYCEQFLYSEITNEQWEIELKKFESNLDGDAVTNNNIFDWKIIIIISVAGILVLGLIIFKMIRKRRERKL